MRPFPRAGVLLPALLILAGVLPGCGSSGGAKEDSPPPKDDFSPALREDESRFDPADYGIEGWASEAVPNQPVPPEENHTVPAETRTDTVPGFRVQVLITREIDAATFLRDSLSGAMPGQWIYIVYHSPYYKVRIGNYTDRFTAAETLDRLRRDGLTDAWVVPDRIVRNPPPVPLPSDTTGLDADSTAPPPR